MSDLKRRAIYNEYLTRYGGTAGQFLDAAFAFVWDNAKLIENAKLQSELADLRDFVRSLRSIEFEDWHGHYSKREPLEFMIVEGDGEIVGKGKDCLAAWEDLRQEA